MHIRFSDLTSMDIQANDGEFGDIHDLLFDDRDWTLRYIVADTGGWLPGRKVLIGPGAIRSIDAKNEQLAVDLTRVQVKESPGIDMDPPVSRQKEEELRAHRSWSPYWDMHPVGFGVGPLIYPVPDAGNDDEVAAKNANADPCLRSAREVKGYRIGASDGEIGQVHDLLFDVESWMLRYVVVDTRVWLPGRKVLLSTSWVEAVDWTQRELQVDLSKDQIKASPEFDPDTDLQRNYEERLHAHYRRHGYWTSDRLARQAAGRTRR